MPISPEPICVDRRIRCDSPPERVGRAAVEAQVIQADAQEQFPAGVWISLSTCRPGVPRPRPGGFDAAEEGVQFVEVEPADVKGCSCLRWLNRSRVGAKPRAPFAVGAGCVRPITLSSQGLHAGGWPRRAGGSGGSGARWRRVIPPEGRCPCSPQSPRLFPSPRGGRRFGNFFSTP